MDSTFEHFLDLAERGNRPGCSSGERHAAKLAAAILEHAVGLDGQAVEGASAFLVMAKYTPSSAGDLLRLWRSEATRERKQKANEALSGSLKAVMAHNSAGGV